MIRKSNQHYQSGFTLVELMLAMAFVAMLLLAIAGVVLQIAGTYNKGVTMQAVNQAGRAIVTDMRRTIASGPQFDVSKALVLQRGSGNATTGTVWGGRFCTGTYTYVWNIGMATVDSNSPRNKYSGTDNTTPLRFVKVIDNGSTYCQLDQSGSKYPDIKKDDATELFADSNLAVQCFQINQMQCQISMDAVPTPAPLTTGASSQLYNMTILISDANQDTLTTVGDCKTPDTVGSYENYCAVNVFDFTAEAGNGGGQ